MTPTVIGVLCCIVGTVIVGKVLKETRGTRKKGGIDPHFFDSLELTIPSASAPSDWGPTSIAQKAKPVSEFDFGPEEELRPTGLAAVGPLGPPDPSPLKTTLPPKGIGFSDPEEEDEGPTQGTLGF